MVSWKSIGRMFGLGDAAASALSASRAEVALALAARLRRPGENLAFSPDSIRIALSMALLSARGETAAEIAAALRLGPSDVAPAHETERARLSALARPGQDVDLTVANGLFLARGVPLDPDGEASLKSHYLARVEALDFARAPDAAAAAINRWVAEATRDLIPEIVSKSALRPETRLVLGNALYFKGDWATKFAQSLTLSAPFSLESGEKVPVQTMNLTSEYRVYVGDDVHALEMDYRGKELCMTLLLPPPGVALADFEGSLRVAALEGWLSRLSAERVQLSLPRFDLDGGGVSLSGPLADMGVTSLFDAGRCDLSGLTRERVAVDDILHRTRLKVTEEGTEAAAATLMFVAQSMARQRPLVFAVNRPFVYLLRDLRDKTILFMGRVVDPRKR